VFQKWKGSKVQMLISKLQIELLIPIYR